ncbi:MAG: gamma-glutamyltransferase [Armatimonadetes bacterium]|nr:gamma-glutamyltransferase [Armatimonadota bacterium]
MFTHRPAVRAPHAMVASAHPLASQAGVAVLRAGGSAVDAGLAVNTVLNVTQCPCCGLGGDGFFLYFEAATGTLHAYNASGRSPAATGIDVIHARGHSVMPTTGTLPINVPGAVDGWAQLHARFGRIPWRELFQPAIGYARDGFPVSDNLSGWIRGSEATLRRWPSSTRAMLPDDRPPLPGERLRQPDLAGSFEALASGGAEAFYRGDIGREIGRAVQADDGLLTADDLAEHQGEWTRPVGIRYRGCLVTVHGPNSQGWALPSMLGLVGDRAIPAPGSADWVHLGVEVKRLAFADRDAYNTDPAKMTASLDRLLDPVYLRRRGEAIRMDHAAPAVSPGGLDGDTTDFCVVDGAGNALSVIQSLYHGFGSGFVAGSTGLFLQNRGAYFSLDPTHVNRLEPRKRTAHTLVSAMVLRDGRPVIVPGSMGGDGQPQTLFQVVTAMLDHGLNPQEAIELPRWVHDGGTVKLEGRFDPAVAEELERRGHRVERLPEWASVCGHCQIIQLTPDGLAGGADPRGDGQAAGY